MNIKHDKCGPFEDRISQLENERMELSNALMDIYKTLDEPVVTLGMINHCHRTSFYTLDKLGEFPPKGLIVDAELKKEPKLEKGEVFIYKQSLRPYVILQVENDEVVYTAASISPAFGKTFRVPKDEFLERFLTPDLVTDDVMKEAVTNTLKHHGLLT